ncbi:MAG: DUF1015 family protein, partial [Thermoplasmata archaeon]|nr:DUF1015 family protein [Thermoplasmata archaeon]
VDEAITRVKSDAIDEAITRVKSNAIDEAITRVKSDAVDEAITRVKSNAQAVFYMNPTRIEEVEAVATNFECMPQKSTFFYPKVWTGFTINILER